MKLTIYSELKKIDFELNCINRNFQSLKFSFGNMIDTIKFSTVCLETLDLIGLDNYAIEMFRNGKSVDLFYCKMSELTKIREIEKSEIQKLKRGLSQWLQIFLKMREIS